MAVGGGGGGDGGGDDGERRNIFTRSTDDSMARGRNCFVANLLFNISFVISPVFTCCFPDSGRFRSYLSCELKYRCLALSSSILLSFPSPCSSVISEFLPSDKRKKKTPDITSPLYHHPS